MCFARTRLSRSTSHQRPATKRLVCLQNPDRPGLRRVTSPFLASRRFPSNVAGSNPTHGLYGIKRLVMQSFPAHNPLPDCLRKRRRTDS
ncbi:hypothetical protein F4827_005693 [Paraburkholderia bannensis]|uniref:Uncharacterized protein n=1 Tax=Paraburkholderia bannensis TaxID=765414 RepID=A0A7W9WWD0_9BURK|nr:hypothetical protein [Paraburkholderia sp. WP4_3_2]MBB6105823.1 hypothetical protein [Paraburkholderia bannensis]